MTSPLNQKIWEKHYSREKSKLYFPDENVVRYITKFLITEKMKPVTLDLGCGSGRHLHLLRNYPGKHYGQDYTLGGSAMSEGTICAMAQRLPYRDESFDFILCWGVLHYLSDSEIKTAIAEIYRVLKKRRQFF